MSNWCMSIMFLWALIACLFVEILVEKCWLLELLLDHTLRHKLGHLWVADFMMLCWFFNYFWSLLNISLVWYNACLFGWHVFALLVCLENAQPFKFCCSLLFLIKISWGRSPLLIFIGHSMPFLCDYNWVLLIMFGCLSLWSFLKHTLSHDFLMFGWLTWLI